MVGICTEDVSAPGEPYSVKTFTAWPLGEIVVDLEIEACYLRPIRAILEILGPYWDNVELYVVIFAGLGAPTRISFSKDTRLGNRVRPSWPFRASLKPLSMPSLDLEFFYRDLNHDGRK